MILLMETQQGVGGDAQWNVWPRGHSWAGKEWYQI